MKSSRKSSPEKRQTKKLSESVDFFGLPLVESEVLVRFNHDGRPAVAVYDISGGFVDRAVSRDFPPEHVDPSVELQGIHYVDTDEDIYPKEVLDLDKLEAEAIEKYREQEQEPEGLD